jgi:hypothetical protein
MKNIFLIFLLTTSFFSKGQTVITGKVVDKFEKPIGFVSIKGENNLIYFTDANGNFNINIDKKTEKFIFTCVGYQSLNVLIDKDSNNLLISLNQITYQLDEVAILSNNKTEKLKTYGVNKFGIGNQLPSPRFQFALFIPNKKKEIGFIKSVSIFMRQPIGGSVDGPFRLRLYSHDTLLNQPGNDLLNSNLIITANNQFSWYTIDVSNYSISYPESGFYISMEILPISNYKKGELKRLGSYQNEYKYPSLGYVNSKKENNSWTFYPDKLTSGGRWRKAKDMNYSIKTQIVIFM